MLMFMTQKVPIVYGEGAAMQVCCKLEEFGCKKVLLIYDSGIEKAGLAGKILDCLADGGYTPQIFVMPDSEPNDELIGQCAQQLDGIEFDSCVALGGGSVIDGSKCILAVLKNKKSIRQYMYHIEGSDPVVENIVPVIAIPTTSGTGSDVSEYAMVVDKQSDFKSWIVYPSAVSLLDPLMTVSLPPSLTAETGMDAFAHAAETATALDSTLKSDILDCYAIREICRWLPVAVKNGGDLEARAHMHIAGSFAGMTFNDVGLHLGHAISHNLGTLFGLTHGIACAIALPETLRFVAAAVPEKVAQIARAMGAKLPDNASSECIGEIAADRLYELLREIGIPSLKQQGFDRQQIVGMAGHVIDVERASGSLANTPGGPITEQVLEGILAKMYDNY